MYYSNRTEFEYLEHTLMDMKNFVETKPTSPKKRLSLSLQRLSLRDSGDSSQDSYSTSLDESSNSISSPVSSGERTDSARDRRRSLAFSWKSRGNGTPGVSHSANTSPRSPTRKNRKGCSSANSSPRCEDVLSLSSNDVLMSPRIQNLRKTNV